MTLHGKEVDMERLPKEVEEHSFGSWTVKMKRSHILQSKCSDTTKCSMAAGSGENELCPLCFYNRKLGLPQIPEMLFPSNVLVLMHSNGCGLEFNALDSLKEISNEKLSLKIACADAWKEARPESEQLGEVMPPFDWTFTTTYKGTLLGGMKATETNERIDIEKLKQKEKILFYNDITLFEDELHDHGVAVCSVKIRVMPSSFFVLLRYFLRVDNVMLRINDTRIYHEFDKDYVLREYTSRESKVQDLKVPPCMFTEPNEIAPYLPLVKSQYERLSW